MSGGLYRPFIRAKEKKRKVQVWLVQVFVFCFLFFSFPVFAFFFLFYFYSDPRFFGRLGVTGSIGFWMACSTSKKEHVTTSE